MAIGPINNSLPGAPATAKDAAASQAAAQEIARLRQRDAAVRRHEQAHAAAGGSFAGAPSYDYTQGPDGKQYAVSGEVSIDAAPVPGNPQATIDKLEIVRRAALAPSDPSPQDLKVAAQAQADIASARAELARERLASARATVETRAGLIAIQEDRLQDRPVSSPPGADGQRTLPDPSSG